MADSSVSITAGSGTPIRVLTGLGAGNADQQVVTLADSAGNLLGTSGAGVPTAGGYTVLASGNLAASNATYDGVTDVSAYSTLRVQISGTWAGSIIFQVSIDGTNWANKLVAGSSTTMITNTAGNGVWDAPIGARYFRLFMSTYTSGTAVATVMYVNAPTSLSTLNVTSLPIGTNGIGSVFIGSSTLVQYAVTSAATTNATSMKASSGRLQELTLTNTSATPMFFKLYNKASAPTLASDTPIAIWRVAATGSAGDTIQIDFGPNGKHFTTGIAWALTGAVTANDTTAVSAGSLISATYI